MLILSRKENEAIVINGDIRITVLGKTSFGQYKLGIEALKDVIIDREEIHEKRTKGVNGNV
jgi:carbon storage regulator